MSSTKPAHNNMRYDLQIIASWIEAGSRVIDLGCGEGNLLKHLITHKQVSGTGIERDEAKVADCIAKGLSVLQGDINEEVLDYPDNSFDYVILSQTLQQVYEPDTLIRYMLRIGKRGIVSFPNFSHWGPRLQLLLSGGSLSGEHAAQDSEIAMTPRTSGNERWIDNGHLRPTPASYPRTASSARRHHSTVSAAAQNNSKPSSPV